MKKMVRKIALIMVLILLAQSFTGCASIGPSVGGAIQGGAIIMGVGIAVLGVALVVGVFNLARSMVAVNEVGEYDDIDTF